MSDLAKFKVIIFGLGGVGSWCAEALVRSGLLNITLVDFDRVSRSNINRQLMATAETVGQVKVEALRDRLLTINPEANVQIRRELFSAENADTFDWNSYNYVVDAMDSLKDKAELILRVSESQATLFSSMGAALKIDPARISIANFSNVKGCPLAAALRKKFRKYKRFPAKDFLCIYDEEQIRNNFNCKATEDFAGAKTSQDKDKLAIKKAVVNGSLVHITGSFGFFIAGLIIKDIYEKNLKF